LMKLIIAAIALTMVTAPVLAFTDFDLDRDSIVMEPGDSMNVLATIQNNSSHGVSVSASSSGRIGFLTFGDTAPGPNTIQGNGRDGVNVNRSSSAIILSNTISNNTRHGVGIFRDSHADVGGNRIESNGFPAPVSPATNDGIRVEENSGVNLGQPGVAFAVGGNTTAANNAGFGLKCRFGGYVRGTLGTLNGNSGPTSLDATCINALGL